MAHRVPSYVKNFVRAFSDGMRCAVCSPITLVVAKCWDPSPKSYLTIPRQEPVRPIDPSAWVNHTEAVRNMEMWGRTGPPSVSTVTSTSSSLISSIPANECTLCSYFIIFLAFSHL